MEKKWQDGLEMDAYTDFADVYDELMDDTPYREWCDFIVEILGKYGAGTEPADDNLRQERNTILDLGCGTGTLTELLARKGYDMIGVDNAQEMLQIAMEKREKSGLDILYLLQDMRELELYGTVGAVVSICDSLNYLLAEEDIVQTFERVNNYLYPQGLFIFDFNTVYKYAVVIGDATIAENREDCSFIWENYYHEKEQINEYDLTIFVKEKARIAGDCGDPGVAGDGKDGGTAGGSGDPGVAGDGKDSGTAVDSGDSGAIGDGKDTGTAGDCGSYRKFQETHYQRGYELEQMKALLRRAGLVFLEAVDADTHEAVRETSERIYIVARKGA